MIKGNAPRIPYIVISDFSAPALNPPDTEVEVPLSSKHSITMTSTTYKLSIIESKLANLSSDSFLGKDTQMEITWDKKAKMSVIRSRINLQPKDKPRLLDRPGYHRTSAAD